MTSEIDTEIGQISPKFPRNPQSDITFCLPTLGRHPTFRTLAGIGELNRDVATGCYKRDLGFLKSFIYTTLIKAG